MRTVHIFTKALLWRLHTQSRLCHLFAMRRCPLWCMSTVLTSALQAADEEVAAVQRAAEEAGHATISAVP